MIVVIAGMQRSGSTLTFNIAREILSALGSVSSASANGLPPIGERSGTDHFLLKTHGPDAEVLGLIATGSVKTICSYRKPEDAVASWTGTFGFDLDHGIASVSSWIAWHRRYAQYALNVDYTAIEREPARVIAAIQHHLLGCVDVQQTELLARRYSKQATYERVVDMKKDDNVVDLGFSYYDPTTFFHRRHVRALESATAEATLEPADLLRIRAAFAGQTDSAHDYVPAPGGALEGAAEAPRPA